jgi:hypothetical protein
VTLTATGHGVRENRLTVSRHRYLPFSQATPRTASRLPIVDLDHSISLAQLDLSHHTDINNTSHDHVNHRTRYHFSDPGCPGTATPTRAFLALRNLYRYRPERQRQNVYRHNCNSVHQLSTTSSPIFIQLYSIRFKTRSRHCCTA